MYVQRRMMQEASRAEIRASLMSPPLGDCTAETARCRDARNYQADLRECCRGHIRQIVADVLDVFESIGITYWLDYGTLLGAIRNPLVGLAPSIRRVQLWCHPVFAGLIVTLLGVFWIARKAVGLI